MNRPLFAILSSKLEAMNNCTKTGNTEWLDRHQDAIMSLVKNHMPSGSGIDTGTHFGLDSKPDKLIFRLSFHHMNQDGYYDGWTDHSVIVTPSLSNGFDLRITGKDRNDIKDYLAEMFDYALRQTIEA